MADCVVNVEVGRQLGAVGLAAGVDVEHGGREDCQLERDGASDDDAEEALGWWCGKFRKS